MTNDQYPMTNQAQNPDDKKFDLAERTTKFGIEIIKFSKKITETSVTKPIIIQLVKSGTSIGANYCEADNAKSRKDFLHKIGICKKEAKETRYWLEMIVEAMPKIKTESERLYQEAKELNLIFSAIVNSTKKLGG